ncbi:5126_t:CDS:2 [Funneliformis mosseae]|uniref:5126_t:CDS:1 n=1 Tax=Funneliformis mosseae TaxID=27381 RepID=A0A9N9CYL0_FUNMO|nr:5126_t:CDS:2 [Funneliformis mosseae]
MGFRRSIKNETSEENDATSNNSVSESHVDNNSSENIQFDTFAELSERRLEQTGLEELQIDIELKCYTTKRFSDAENYLQQEEPE